jgi:glycosyltransferase involved in cell wall biosynthesis
MMEKVYAVCFGQFGPYHHARVSALQGAVHLRNEQLVSGASSAIRVLPVQISATTRCGSWTDDASEIGGKCKGLRTLCDQLEDEVDPKEVYIKALRLFRAHHVDLAFLPSYSPARLLALFAAAKTLGIRTVMMNESHAGTDRARGWKKQLKRQIVKRFDAALVGGEPHKRHFSSLGIPEAKIFTGYDAIDNLYFVRRAAEVRAESNAYRSQYGLPQHYFLSMGRMVEKKNLFTLLEAYGQYVQAALREKREDAAVPTPPISLVFVGSGEDEERLESTAQAMGLRTFNRRSAGPTSMAEGIGLPGHDQTLDGDQGSVFFYGYRQIDENPIFYALSDVFILPSRQEEWGLVVNEAMACSLPVIVSSTAGCAEDLLPIGSPTPDQSLEERSNGYVFDPSSPAALAEALTRVALSSPSALEGMGVSSREIVSRYSCEEFARKALLAARAALT